MNETIERDLWKEARDQSSKYTGSIFLHILVAVLKFLFPKRFQALTVKTFGAGQSLLCVDLNKYRPDVNVEMLIDQGVRMFMLRVIGPTRWVYGAWNYETDITFVTYYQRIRAYATQKGVKVWIMGYGVHNPWANEQSNYTGPDPQVHLLKEATRNHICDLYSWDDEVATCWKDGKETTCTAVNLVKSISICMEQTFLEMERNADGSRKMPVHYSANWYMKKYAPKEYQAWLDNTNRDVETRHFLTWRAWLPTVFSQAFALISELFDKVISPTGIQENSFLRMGSELAADLWQCTFSAIGPWCADTNKDGKPEGIDASISYGPSATIQQFAYNANLSLATEPEEPEDPENPPVGLYLTTADFEKWKKEDYQKHVHPAQPPA
jgi:hypothetical protein